MDRIRPKYGYLPKRKFNKLVSYDPCGRGWILRILRNINKSRKYGVG